MNTSRTHITAATIADGSGLVASPGAILLENGCVVAAGEAAAIGSVGDAQQVHVPDSVVIPALVNAHAHLDLTHIGPLPYSGDFSTWLGHVLAERNAIDETGVFQSTLKGAELAKAGGTALVGDIAGAWSLEPVRALRASDLAGVSFLEVFGIGQRQQDAVAKMRQVLEGVARHESDVHLGISPHAPYTCGRDVYAAAAQLGLPLATHLAESLEELQFCATAVGAFAELLQRVGVWDDSIVGQGGHPVPLLSDLLTGGPHVAAHLNYVDDACIDAMTRCGLSVAYCPRASAYFGHPHAEHPPHRYRDMLAAGINVALGTDSILCLQTPDRISVLDEMRFLYRRDGTDPLTLLAMATVNGAKALGFDPNTVSLSEGPINGLIAVPGRTLPKALVHDDAPTWIAPRSNSGLS